MLLMDRDKILFGKLHKYAVMTTKQVAATIFPGVDVSTVLRRLRKLEDFGYIERIEGLSNYNRVWVLTEKGALMVSDRQPRRRQSRFQLEHDVMLTALRLKLEDHGISKFWIPEHEMRAKVCAKEGVERAKKKTIPDGLMGVECKDYKESIAIELELNSKNARRYQRTFWDYRNKSNLLAVWYLTPTEQLAKHIEKLWLKENREIEKPGFLWSLASEVVQKGGNATVHRQGTKRLLRELWKGDEDKIDAHSPAHRVGKLDEMFSGKKEELTTENDEEILAPAI